MRTVLSNDLQAQWEAIRPEATSALERVGRSGSYILGSEVKTFESELALRFGCDFAVGTGNGLDALELALRACGVTAGTKVLTTPLSAFATTLAIVRAGGIPVFVDVDSTGLLDLDQAETRLAAGDIDFLLPVHLYGHALDLERAAEIARRNDATLIEDCAQAIQAKSHGVPVGSIGTIAATSFYPTKNLGCLGDGGACVTNDAVLAETCRTLRDYGQSSKYVHSELGMNSRLDELQAAFLRSAILPRLDDWTARRRDIAATYRDGLRSENIELPGTPRGSDSVFHLFPILCVARDAFIKHLRDNGVQSSVHYPSPISRQSALRTIAFEDAFSPVNAARFSEMEVSLPIHPFMTDDDVAHVIDVCNGWNR